MKPIEPTPHCKLRMAERGVREEDARAVVQKREIDVPGRHGRRRIMGRIESRTLNVVIEETDDKIWMRSVSWV